MIRKGGMMTIMIIINIFLLISCAQAIAPDDLIISKVQITGGTGKTSEDYITIYNKTTDAIDLNGLRLVKRTKTGTTDTTIKSWVSPTLVNANSYYTWANSTNDFATSIKADCSSTQTIADDNGIALRNGAENTGTIIDSFAWGGASNIFVENLPFSTNHIGGEYYEKINNQDTNNNSLDWQIIKPYVAPICGNNILETGETCDDGNTNSNDGCSSLCQIEQIKNILGDVRINELVSDPESGDEWIELYNTTDKTIDLNNWTIEDGSGTKNILATTINKFYVLDKPKGALNNAGDIVILKNADGDIIDSLTYGDWDDGNINDNAPVANKPYSLARIHDGESTNNDNLDFKITTTITKETTNIITEPINNENEATNTITQKTYDYNRDIIISEIFPNPVGIDKNANNGEFIELYNNSDNSALLDGWRIEVNDLVMEIPLGTTIYPRSYLNLNTKNILPLPNDKATVKLFQPLKQTSLQSVSYKDALEGQSYANFLTSGWQWTTEPTPGVANVLRQKPLASFDLISDPITNEPLQFDSSDSFLDGQIATYSWTFGDGQISEQANPEHIFTKSGKQTINLTIKTIYGSSTVSKKINILKNESTDNNDLTIASLDEKTSSQKPITKTTSKKTTSPAASVSGTVVVEPNIFGIQYFYLLPNNSQQLYQVYNSQKLFPDLKIGDEITVSGTYSNKETGPQIKTKNKDDIKIIGQNVLPKPSLSFNSDLKTGPYPRLALVGGEITAKKSPRFYLSDKTGDSEIYLASKTKISLSNFSLGDKLAVTGILNLVNGQPRLQPRSMKDISKINLANKTEDNLLAKENSNPLIETQSPTNKKSIIFIGCLVFSVLIIGLITYLLKIKKPRQ